MNPHTWMLLVALLFAKAGSAMAQRSAVQSDAGRDSIDARLARASQLTSSKPAQALDAAKAGLAIFQQLGEPRDVCRMYIAMGIINPGRLGG